MGGTIAQSPVSRRGTLPGHRPTVTLPSTSFYKPEEKKEAEPKPAEEHPKPTPTPTKPES